MEMMSDSQTGDLGTDDDFPASHCNRISRGVRVEVNQRHILGFATHSQSHTIMEAQIHLLEQEAYSAVLRAFKAQSDALTWEKEGLITELRKELRVSYDEHREFLTRVDADEVLQKIRKWRLAGETQTSSFNSSQTIRDIVSNPFFSASQKKQKTLQSSQQFFGLSPVKSSHFPSTGHTRNRLYACRASAALMANESAEIIRDPLIGRKVWTKWPDDNNFYEAVITDHNSAEGRHALAYDINTANESWEWVDLREIPPKDIRWEGEDPGISYRGDIVGATSVMKKPSSHGTLAPTFGREHGSMNTEIKEDFPPQQNGSAREASGDIELLNTEILIKEVERMFGVSHPDPIELEKAKKMLKEHEHALVNAIAKLASGSDSDGEHQV